MILKTTQQMVSTTKNQDVESICSYTHTKTHTHIWYIHAMCNVFTYYTLLIYYTYIYVHILTYE